MQISVLLHAVIFSGHFTQNRCDIKPISVERFKDGGKTANLIKILRIYS